MNEEIKKSLNTFLKGTSKTSDTYANLNCFVNHKFNLSKKEGEKFTKSLTMRRCTKKTLLNPMSSIFLAKKENYESAKLLKEEKQLKKLSKKGLSEEEQKELDELLS